MRKINYLAFVLFGAHACFAADCQSGPAVHCVDLCKVDPGNRLNSTDYSETEVSRTYGGSCQTWDGPDRVSGHIAVIQYKTRVYSICSSKWYESTIQRSGCMAN